MYRVVVNILVHPVKDESAFRKVVLLGRKAPDVAKTLMEIFLDRIDEDDLLELLLIYDKYTGEKRKIEKKKFILEILTGEGGRTDEEPGADSGKTKGVKRTGKKERKATQDGEDDFWTKYGAILE